MNKILFRESVWQPVEEYSFKEEFDTEGTIKGVKIEGVALDTSKPSRNGVLYDHNSVVNSCKILEGKPMLLNHDDKRLPIGHVEKVWMEGTLMKYKADLDPEEKDLVRKIKRKDIHNVSIQTLVEEVSHEEDLVTGKGYTRAFPNDWAELSIVTIPGFAETTIKMAEALKIENALTEKLSSVSVKKKDEEFFEKIIKKNKLKVHSKIREGTNISYTLDDGIEEPEIVEEQKSEGPTIIEEKKEDVNTSNASALIGTAMAKKIMPAVEPFGVKDFKPLEEALDVIKLIENLKEE